MKFFQSIALLLILPLGAFTQQKVAINNDDSAPHPLAILDVKSNSKGVLIPRLTTVERNAIMTPPIGLLVFDIDEKSFFFYHSIANGWQNIIGSLELPYIDVVDGLRSH